MVSDHDDSEYYTDCDYTENGFDYIENVLLETPPIPRDQGDTALIVHVAQYNVDLLRVLLKNHVVFPRDSVMVFIGSGKNSIRYDSEGARLLVEYGGMPSGEWLLNAMIDIDDDAIKWLDTSGARLDAYQRAKYYISSSFLDNKYDDIIKVLEALERYSPRQDEYARYLICKWFKVDLAEVRGIDFNYFHDEFSERDDDYYTDMLVDEKLRLEEEFGFEINWLTFNRAWNEWDRTAIKKDRVLLENLDTHRINGLNDSERIAKKFEEWFEEHSVGTIEEDISEYGFRILTLVCYFMDDEKEHVALRLNMLKCLIENACIDVNAFVGEYDFHIDTIRDEMNGDPFQRYWLPGNGRIESEHAIADATMLDISVHKGWTDASKMLLSLGARVDCCLTWTRILLEDRYRSKALELIIDFNAENVKRAWGLLRRVVFKLGKICIFMKDLYLQSFLPDGPAVKRARILFDSNKEVLNNM